MWNFEVVDVGAIQFKIQNSLIVIRYSNPSIFAHFLLPPHQAFSEIQESPNTLRASL
jgi:hypothetical protein